jgi:hypothetical protein
MSTGSNNKVQNLTQQNKHQTQKQEKKSGLPPKPSSKHFSVHKTDGKVRAKSHRKRPASGTSKSEEQSLK